jgi:hypothetical protein
MNQYIKMLPAMEKKPGTGIRKQEILKLLPPDFQLTELGRRLFGLESWQQPMTAESTH